MNVGDWRTIEKLGREIASDAARIERDAVRTVQRLGRAIEAIGQAGAQQTEMLDKRLTEMRKRLDTLEQSRTA